MQLLEFGLEEIYFRPNTHDSLFVYRKIHSVRTESVDVFFPIQSHEPRVVPMRSRFGTNTTPNISMNCLFKRFVGFNGPHQIVQDSFIVCRVFSSGASRMFICSQLDSSTILMIGFPIFTSSLVLIDQVHYLTWMWTKINKFFNMQSKRSMKSFWLRKIFDWKMKSRKSILEMSWTYHDHFAEC